METTHMIRDFVVAHGGKCCCLRSVYKSTDEEDFAVADIPEDTEIIMVLGGDGTLIRAAARVEALAIPLIGVNLGTLGYLCELEPRSVCDAVLRLMEERYILEDRIMLCGKKVGSSGQRIAMNDVVIHHGGDIKLLMLNVYVNGQFLYTYNADGIIISTPTGSTGYSMSAGGPIVDPKCNMILLTPNNTHSLNSKSIVLDGDDCIEIELAAARSYEHSKVYVSCDGDRVCQLMPGERFRVVQAANRMRICKINNRSFLQSLRKKMESYR